MKNQQNNFIHISSINKQKIEDVKKDIESFPVPFLLDFLSDLDYFEIFNEINILYPNINFSDCGEKYWSDLENCLTTRKIPYLEDLTDNEYQKYLSKELTINDYRKIQNRCYTKSS